MSPFRPVFVFLCASLAVHTAVVMSLGKPWLGGTSVKSSEPIPISYLEPERPSLQAPVQEEFLKAPAVKKKIRGIPIPRMPVKESPEERTPERDFQKIMQDKLKKQQAQLARMTAAERNAAFEKTQPKTGAEIMADPKKGKIFVGYFSNIKRKIQKTLLERYARRYSGRGSVALTFVLNARGALEKVVVTSKSSDADEMLEDMAVQCLRIAAPFGDFPRELGSQRIAFNVTIFFDGQ